MSHPGNPIQNQDGGAPSNLDDHQSTSESSHTDFRDRLHRSLRLVCSQLDLHQCMNTLAGCNDLPELRDELQRVIPDHLERMNGAQLVEMLREFMFVPLKRDPVVLALFRVVTDPNEGHRFVHNDGIMALMSVMQNALDSLAIQKYGCGILQHLAMDHQRDLHEAGAIHAIVTAMSQYPTEVGDHIFLLHLQISI